MNAIPEDASAQPISENCAQAWNYTTSGQVRQHQRSRSHVLRAIDRVQKLRSVYREEGGRPVPDMRSRARQQSAEAVRRKLQQARHPLIGANLGTVQRVTGEMWDKFNPTIQLNNEWVMRRHLSFLNSAFFLACAGLSPRFARARQGVINQIKSNHSPCCPPWLY